MSERESALSYFGDITIRVRHGDEKTPCPAVVLTEGFHKALGAVEELKLQPANIPKEGWWPVFVEAKAMLTQDDFGSFEKYANVLTKPFIDPEPAANRTIMYLNIKDPILNLIMEKSHSYQLLTQYVATPSYEDFSIRIFPIKSLDPLLEDLEKESEVKLIEKETKPLRQLQFIEREAFSELPILNDNEMKILREFSESGWFDYPRPEGATMEAIAKKIGTNASELSIGWRTINRKMALQFFHEGARRR